MVKTAASHAVNIGSNPVRVTIEFQTRCLKFNLVLDKQNARQYNIVCFRAVPDDIELVLIRARVHPFPFRTRQLSSFLLTILGWRRPGKIGSANTERQSIDCLFFVIVCNSFVRIYWTEHFKIVLGSNFVFIYEWSGQ